MTEHDGLTAEQEAARAASWMASEMFPTPSENVPTRVLGELIGHRASVSVGFMEGAEWATKREKARAEAAEAQVAELEAALSKIRAHEMTGQKVTGCVRCWTIADAALATPATEAVTEVEGS